MSNLRAAMWSAIDVLEDGATWLAREILFTALEEPDDAPDLGAYPSTSPEPTPLREGSAAYEGGTAA